MNSSFLKKLKHEIQRLKSGEYVFISVNPASWHGLSYSFTRQWRNREAFIYVFSGHCFHQRILLTSQEGAIFCHGR